MSNPLLDELSDSSVNPSVDIALPTRGYFYPEGEVLADGIDPDNMTVQPLAALDESAFRDPLLLISGHAIGRMIRKVCPGVIDPGSMSDLDIQTILIACRIASYGPKLELKHTCKECQNETTFQIDLNEHIQQYTAFTPEQFDSFRLVLPKAGQKVMLRPVRYEDSVAMSIDLIKSSSQLDDLTKSTDDALSEEFILKYRDQMEAAIQTNLRAVLSSILFVETKKGDRVSDPEFITEWLKILPPEDFKAITKKITEIGDELREKSKLEYECQNCGTANTIYVELDPQKLFTQAEESNPETSSSAKSTSTEKTTKRPSKASRRLS